MEPFFPMQNYPGKDDESDVLLGKWGADLIRILDSSKGVSFKKTLKNKNR